MLKQEQLHAEPGSDIYRQFARVIFDREADFAAVMATRYEAVETGDPLPALHAEARALARGPKWKRCTGSNRPPVVIFTTIYLGAMPTIRAVGAAAKCPMLREPIGTDATLVTPKFGLPGYTIVQGR